MTYQNPSEGKFDAPPLPAAPEEDRRRIRWRTIALLLVVVSLGVQWILEHRLRGLAGLAAGLLAFLLLVTEFIVDRKRADEVEGKDPYSPPTSVTR